MYAGSAKGFATTPRALQGSGALYEFAGYELVTDASAYGAHYEWSGENRMLVDLDGDGVLDQFAVVPGTSSFTWARGGTGGAWQVPAELLSKITAPTGLTTQLTYLPSSMFGAAPFVPVRPVLSTATSA